MDEWHIAVYPFVKFSCEEYVNSLITGICQVIRLLKITECA